MLRMTILQLALVVFAICISTQVVSQNTTESKTNSTYNGTTMPPETFSSANSTSPAGASVSLNAGPLSVLTPVIMAALLLQQRYC